MRGVGCAEESTTEKETTPEIVSDLTNKVIHASNELKLSLATNAPVATDSAAQPAAVSDGEPSAAGIASAASEPAASSRDQPQQRKRERGADNESSQPAAKVKPDKEQRNLSLIHISEPTRPY